MGRKGKGPRGNLKLTLPEIGNTNLRMDVMAKAKKKKKAAKK
jgi:hypothetical protein